MTEFESLLRGVETALDAADLGARRLSDDELFREAKRALNVSFPDHRSYRRPEELSEYRSAREQLVDVSLTDETDSYLNIGGILYSFVSLKELPTTFTRGKDDHHRAVFSFPSVEICFGRSEFWTERE